MPRSGSRIYNPVSTTHSKKSVMDDSGRVAYVTEVTEIDFRDSKKGITIYDFTIENLTEIGAVSQLKHVSLDSVDVDSVNSAAASVFNSQVVQNEAVKE